MQINWKIAQINIEILVYLLSFHSFYKWGNCLRSVSDFSLINENQEQWAALVLKSLGVIPEWGRRKKRKAKSTLDVLAQCELWRYLSKYDKCVISPIGCKYLKSITWTTVTIHSVQIIIRGIWFYQHWTMHWWESATTGLCVDIALWGTGTLTGGIYTFTAFIDFLEDHPLHSQTQTAD